MPNNELVARAQALCRALRRPFPPDLRQYASQWDRERFDAELCWQRVKPLLLSGRPLWQAEAEIRRHHAELRRARDDRDRQAGEPLAVSPTSDADRHWGSEGHLQVVPPPAAPPDRDGLSAERHPAPRQRYSKRTDTKAHRVREFLRAHVVRRGPIAVLRLEPLAKNEGLLGRARQSAGPRPSGGPCRT